jgi:F-type H+-transporting ATPase subunit epsilon
VDYGELSFLPDATRSLPAYAEVSSSKVTVLGESAERADRIERERATRAKERAVEKLAELRKEDSEFERARLNVATS